MKEFLSRAGYDIVARNVDEDHAAYSELLALGVRAVPLTIINGRQIAGFDPGAIEQALGAAWQP